MRLAALKHAAGKGRVPEALMYKLQIWQSHQSIFLRALGRYSDDALARWAAAKLGVLYADAGARDKARDLMLSREDPKLRQVLVRSLTGFAESSDARAMGEPERRKLAADLIDLFFAADQDADLRAAITDKMASLAGDDVAVPLPLLKRFFPVMQFGFVVNAFSGILLLIAYPTKALTNPVFYIKLGCIAGAVAVVLWMQRRILVPEAPGVRGPSTARVWAIVSLVLWAGAILAGRLLAYTCSWMMVGARC